MSARQAAPGCRGLDPAWALGGGARETGRALAGP